jgi:hypothetical protein
VTAIGEQRSATRPSPGLIQHQRRDFSRRIENVLRQYKCETAG